LDRERRCRAASQAAGSAADGRREENHDMIIELEDDYGDVETVDTETASREELAEALVKLRKQWDQAWDKRAETLDADGLDFTDIGKKATLYMVDPDKAFAGLRRMHAEFVEKQIDKRRQGQDRGA
jgi:hypothetical protein